jgi:hypothetical protein
MNDPNTPTVFSCADAAVLMRCYWSPEVDPVRETDRDRDAITRFIAYGAVKMQPDDTVQCTPLGRAWVRAMLNTPMPRLAYLDAAGNEIKD